jgi:hypothetical protein
MSRPTRASEAGRAYLDLQNRARAARRGTQELLTLYVVERWLARLSLSGHADKFVIKGGMLLAAYDARRPTADLDALARSIAYDQEAIVSLVSEVAELHLGDGVQYQTSTATTRVIREWAPAAGHQQETDPPELGPCEEQVKDGPLDRPAQWLRLRLDFLPRLAGETSQPIDHSLMPQASASCSQVNSGAPSPGPGSA